jgi:hypothetical protein
LVALRVKLTVAAIAVIFLLLSSSVGSSTKNDSTAALSNPEHTPANVLVSKACSYESNAEVEQALDPRSGNIYEAWIGCGGIGFAKSTDGGRSFHAALTVPGSSGVPSWDPAIAVGPDGEVYVSFMASESAGTTPIVAISKNNGTTFSKYYEVMVPNTEEFSDRDFVAVSPSWVIYVTWNCAPDASLIQISCASGGSCYYTAGDLNIVIVSSSDGGKTWSKLMHVTPNYPRGGGVSAPLLVEPDGQIDVLYEAYHTFPNYALGAGHNYFVSSTDGGKTWSKRVLVGGGGNGRHLSDTDWWIDGAIARDSSGVLYASFDTQGASSDTAWLSFSTDGGLNWSSPLRVNTDTSSSPNIMVEVAGASAGTAYVSWMTNALHGGWEIYMRSFSANTSSFSSSERISSGVGANGVWGGDTTGITFLGGQSVALSWGYDIAGTSQIYAAVADLPPP